MRIYRASLLVVKPKVVKSGERVTTLQNYQEVKIAVTPKLRNYQEIITQTPYSIIPEKQLHCPGMIADWPNYPIGLAHIEPITWNNPQLLEWLSKYLQEHSKENWCQQFMEWYQNAWQCALEFWQQYGYLFSKESEKYQKKIIKKLKKE